jgi:hypothetical protein
MHAPRPFGAGLDAARPQAALARERPLRGDEGIDVLFDIGRTPGLAALGELDRPSGPMGCLHRPHRP